MPFAVHFVVLGSVVIECTSKDQRLIFDQSGILGSAVIKCTTKDTWLVLDESGILGSVVIV